MFNGQPEGITFGDKSSEVVFTTDEVVRGVELISLGVDKDYVCKAYGVACGVTSKQATSLPLSATLGHVVSSSKDNYFLFVSVGIGLSSREN